MALGTAAVAYGIGSQNASRRDQDWNAALAAAEAGIDDYVFRLNENSNYCQYSASNLPPDGNQAFTGWQAVQGPANQSKLPLLGRHQPAHDAGHDHASRRRAGPAARR